MISDSRIAVNALAKATRFSDPNPFTTTMSINATELMWDFFEKHPKP